MEEDQITGETRSARRGISARSNWLRRRHEEIVGSVGIFRALGLIVLISVGIWQFSQQWQLENAARAEMQYRDFLALEIAAPDLALGPDPGTLSPEDAARYRAFLASMMLALDGVLSFPPESPHWVATATRHLQTHCLGLKPSNFASSELSPSLAARLAQFQADAACPAGG